MIKKFLCVAAVFLQTAAPCFAQVSYWNSSFLNDIGRSVSPPKLRKGFVRISSENVAKFLVGNTIIVPQDDAGEPGETNSYYFDSKGELLSLYKRAILKRPGRNFANARAQYAYISMVKYSFLGNFYCEGPPIEIAIALKKTGRCRSLRVYVNAGFLTRAAPFGALIGYINGYRFSQEILTVFLCQSFATILWIKKRRV